MIRIIALLGLTFLLASCGDGPEKETEGEVTQNPDPLATAKADAQAQIAIAKALKANVATEKVKYLKQKKYSDAVDKAEILALKLEIDLTTATDVNKIKDDTQELKMRIAITNLMTKNSASLADAKAQAKKVKDMANSLDPATVPAGAGHDELVSKINDAKHTADATKGIGRLDAAIAAAGVDNNATRTALDNATHTLEQEILAVRKLYENCKKAIKDAQDMIARANAFADAHGGLYVNGAAYDAAVLAAKTGNKDAADKLTALIANNATTVAKVKSKTNKLKALIAAIEAVGTKAKQAAAMAKYTALTLATATDVELANALADLKALNAAEKAYDTNAATDAIAAIELEQAKRAAKAIADGYTNTEIKQAEDLYNSTNDVGDNSNGIEFADKTGDHPKDSRAAYLIEINKAKGAVTKALNDINTAGTVAAVNAVVANGSALHTAIHTTLGNATGNFNTAISKNP
jgi:hypothetical protein